MFSKLKKKVELLFDPKLLLKVRMTQYRIGRNAAGLKSRASDPYIERIWFTLDKDIIWDFPKNIPEDTYIDFGVRDIFDILGNYSRTPKEKLLSSDIDKYGLTPLLLSADKRIGYRRFDKLLLKFPDNEIVHNIISHRKNSK